MGTLIGMLKLVDTRVVGDTVGRSLPFSGCEQLRTFERFKLTQIH